MSSDAWITLAVVVVTMGVLASERFQPMLVMLGANVALLLTGVLGDDEAFLGFANPAPLTIACLYVLARGAETTGALGNLTDRAFGAGTGSERAALTRIAAPTAAISAFIANTPLVSILAPRVTSWAERGGRSPSRFLIPLSYAALLGGCITVIGTSTNLVVSGLLEANGEEPLSLFEITPVGLPIAVLGVAVLVLTAPRLLPDRTAVSEGLDETGREFTLEMLVAPDGPLVGRTVADAGLRHLEGVFLVAIERAGRTIAPVAPTRALAAGDRLTFAGNVKQVLDLQRVQGLTSAEEPHLEVLGSGPDRRVYEVVVSERSPLVGSTLVEVGFRNRYRAAVLAVHRASQRLDEKLGRIRLRAGDVLLVVADAGFSERWRDRDDFLVVAGAEGEPPLRRDKRWIVEAATVGFVVASAAGWLGLLEAAIVAAAIMVGAGVLSPAEAGRAINANVFVIMATSISIGTAVATSGLAEQIGERVVDVGGSAGDLGILAAVLLGTMVMTELLSNNAAAALMLPIGLSSAAQAGLDPRGFAVAVLIGASLTFLTPIGYQTNTMVYGMGGYRFTDFTRVGFPLTIVVIATSLVLIPVAFPL